MESWTFVFVAIPPEDSDDIKLAAKDGRYLLPLRVAVRRAADIDEDDVVAVQLRLGRE